MTDDRKFKDAVRARMEQTGESYTAARAGLRAQDAAMLRAPVSRPRVDREPWLEEIAAEIVESDRREQERRAHWPRTARGDLDTLAAMTQLACSFPMLQKAAGVSPWDVELFMRGSCGPAATGGSVHASRFVLHVWNPHEDWIAFGREIGIEGAALAPFHLSDALNKWDDAHADAFRTWVRWPFWP